MTLLISERLQNEVARLCKIIGRDEWSGTLFYKLVEGNFGQDKCVLQAEHVYLQDIGTSVYTEYEYGPDYFKYLMDHPELMDMKVGHIHSHNNMAVFFSGTDDQELVDNAPNHNFYLSLIVNNNNDMCARVAFKVDKKQGSLLEWKDLQGNVTSQFLYGDKKQVETSINFYECDVIRPTSIVFVDDRIETIRKTKPQRTVFDDRIKFSNNYRGGAAIVKEVDVPLFDIFDDVVQTELFEQDYLVKPVQEHTPRQRSLFTPSTSKKTLVSSSKQTVSFTVALLTGDVTNDCSIGEILDRLDDSLDTNQAIIKYADIVVNNILSSYGLLYPEDLRGDNLKPSVLAVVEALNAYVETYDHLVNPFSEALLKEVNQWTL